ncbi:hypothetical protein [Herbiconiux solani]|uniref:hypothetical protein n=1 Tax=Herbiconiux solani TaxID=661329 RepID=UPI000823FDD1|nr:hypothetical protein [Herbiconiux solani]
MLMPDYDNADPMLGPEQLTNVAQFAKQGWSHRGGTAGERAALPTAEKFPGLVWQDTDNGAFRRQWDGTQWKLRGVTWGKMVAATTDAASIVSVAHPLGVTPDWVTVAPMYSGDIAWDKVSDFMVWSLHAGYVEVRARRVDTTNDVGVRGVNFAIAMGMQ